MFKKLALALLLIFSSFANADESDFIKPINNQAFDNYMMQVARYNASLFKQGKPSLIDGFFIGPLSPSNVRDTYEHNELAAKQKFTGRSIRIEGEIESINEDAFGKGYIVAVDDVSRMSSLEGIYLQIDKNDPDYLQLGKGDDIDVICQIGSYIIGIPSLSKCFLTSNLFKPKSFENLSHSMTGHALLKANDISTENIANIKVSLLIKYFIYYAIMYKGNENKNEQSCLNDDQKCTQAFLNDNNQKKNTYANSHERELKELGSRLISILKQQQPKTP